jgi:NADH-quinone oxidoreductase subunit D
MEKTGEELTYVQGATNVTRIDYAAPLSNELVWAMAVERLLDVEVPPRAVWARMMLQELGRIGSHLLFQATNGMDIGAVSMLLYGWREREELLRLLEMITGLRMNHNFIRPGGIAADLPDGWQEETLRVCNIVEAGIAEYDSLLTENPIWLERMVGVGTITTEQALSLGVTGPILRSTGFAWDLRTAQPYLAYDEVDFEVIYTENGDCFDRYRIRLYEIAESIKIVRQCVEKMPRGDYRLQDKKVTPPPRPRINESMEALIHHFKLFTEGFKVPAGETYVTVESPRGEIGCYLVSDGTGKPSRLHIRGPSFYNLAAMAPMMEDRLVAGASRIERRSHHGRGGPVGSSRRTATAPGRRGEAIRASAVLPLLHLAQEQDGWVSPAAIEEVAAWWTSSRRRCSGRAASARCTSDGVSARRLRLYERRVRTVARALTLSDRTPGERRRGRGGRVPRGLRHRWCSR